MATKRDKKCGLLFFVFFCVFCDCPSFSEEPVKAELGAESAWVGQAVPLHITLYAPGPFSGTASFDLPELPRTFIIKQGRPIVGSETIGGETWMTQRHQFHIYTQGAGNVEIPPIHVRFEAKRDFLSDAQPFEGTTPVLRFESRHPPGIQSGAVVVSTPNMEIEQTWSPRPGQALEAGDVVERRIVRRATKTTGMVLPDPSLSAPVGVRVYSAEPIIHDKTERGESTAERIDTIRYQFSAGGKFQLPALEFRWWNLEKEQLETKSLDGAEFKVAALATKAADQPDNRQWIWWFALLPLLWILKLIAGRILKPLRQTERLAVKAVVSACRRNHPDEAYAALLHWSRITGITPPPDAPFAEEWELLSRTLYSAESMSWKGRALASAFKSFRKQWLRKGFASSESPALPELNPTSLSTGTRRAGTSPRPCVGGG